MVCPNQKIKSFNGFNKIKVLLKRTFKIFSIRKFISFFLNVQNINKFSNLANYLLKWSVSGRIFPDSSKNIYHGYVFHILADY